MIQSAFTDAVRERLARTLSELLEATPTPAAAATLASSLASYRDRPARLVRARVLAASARAFGGAADEVVIHLAAATELLHLFALMHDDLIDGDAPRRAERAGAQAHSLLAGNLAFVGGYALLSDVVARRRLNPAILDEVRESAAQTIVGQLADIGYQRSDATPSIEALLRLYDAKAGRYTVTAPLRIGALAAGASAATAERLGELGRPLGRAFQLIDDLHDTPDTPTADAAPPWEHNLRVTWECEREEGESLSRFAHRLLERLEREAAEVAGRVDPPGSAPLAFLDELFAILGVPVSAR